jgi:hypothetical protein
MPYFGIPIRNGLPIGLGSVAGFGVQQFSPADLFSAGEQGAWYDPSDLTTLFQDSAGTTPVTAVEQFVGLMLDKSKGLVLGSELVTNGGPFTNTTGWTASASTLSVVSSALRVTENGVGVNPTVRQSFAVTAGRTYQIVINVTNLNMLNFQVWVGSAYNAADWLDSDSFTTTGTRTLVFRAGGATAFFEVVGTCTAGGTSEYFDIGTISVKELAGNHATQTTSAKRPKLAARYNLLTYSEQFDNGVWTKSTASVTAPTAIVAPDGTLTTDKLVEGVGTARKFIHQSGATLNQTVSIYAQKGERDFVAIGQTNTAGFWAVSLFNLNLGTYVASYEAGSQPIPTNNTITSVGNNWYRISCTLNGTSMANPVIMISNGGNPIFEGYTGDGTSGIYIWGADLRPASQATGLIGPTYQRVVDAATYDAVGFLPYLQFDGLSWSMSTNSIDFSAVPTDKMTVWAGVRKLSDANTGTVAQLSPSTSTNNGVFGLYVPFNTGASADYAWQSKGTTRITVNSPVNIGPATSVFTGVGNISAPLAQLRQNAIQVATSSASQGTGNFGNFVLNIGEGAGFLNGWLTSLIVCGAQSTQSQIEATESWVNGKTGAF